MGHTGVQDNKVTDKGTETPFADTEIEIEIEREEDLLKSELLWNLQGINQLEIFLVNYNQEWFQKLISLYKNGRSIITAILTGYCRLRKLNTLKIKTQQNVDSESQQKKERTSITLSHSIFYTS